VCAFRPLPPYDGSCGPLPATDVTNDDLLRRYGITKPTLFKRRDALVDKGWVSPFKVGPRLYYTAQDVHLLDCCNYWSRVGYSIPEIVAHLSNQEKAYKKGAPHDEDDENAFEGPPKGQAIDVAAENSTTDLVVRGLQTSAKDLQLLGEEFVEKFARSVGEAVRQAVPRDVLAAHDFLAKAADKGYVLSSKILAEGMGFKVSTVHGWADGSDRYGFRMHRVGKGQWKIRRLTDAEIEEAAEIESRPLGSGWVNINNGGNAA
jgi:DNA-binding transcriptional MerR regulator